MTLASYLIRRFKRHVAHLRVERGMGDRELRVPASREMSINRTRRRNHKICNFKRSVSLQVKVYLCFKAFCMTAFFFCIVDVPSLVGLSFCITPNRLSVPIFLKPSLLQSPVEDPMIPKPLFDVLFDSPRGSILLLTITFS